MASSTLAVSALERRRARAVELANEGLGDEEIGQCVAAEEGRSKPYTVRAVQGWFAVERARGVDLPARQATQTAAAAQDRQARRTMRLAAQGSTTAMLAVLEVAGAWAKTTGRLGDVLAAAVMLAEQDQINALQDQGLVTTRQAILGELRPPPERDFAYIDGLHRRVFLPLQPWWPRGPHPFPGDFPDELPWRLEGTRRVMEGAYRSGMRQRVPWILPGRRSDGRDRVADKTRRTNRREVDTQELRTGVRREKSGYDPVRELERWGWERSNYARDCRRRRAASAPEYMQREHHEAAFCAARHAAVLCAGVQNRGGRRGSAAPDFDTRYEEPSPDLMAFPVGPFHKVFHPDA